MKDVETANLLLHPIDVGEGERIVSRSPGPLDVWAEDFPFEGDVAAVTMFLRANATCGEQRPFGYYRVTRRSDGLAVGGIGFKGKPISSCVEIGYGLVPSARGQRHATEAIVGILGIAEKLEISRVTAITTFDNVASQRTLVRAGFHLTSTSGELWHYELRFQRGID